MRRKATLLAVVLLASACAGESVETTATAPVDEQRSSTTSSTTTTVAAVTTTEAGPMMLEEIRASGDTRRLLGNTSYSLDVESLGVVFQPPGDGWELLGYVRSGSAAGALFGWRGPTGFRPETLDVLIWDIGGSGLEAAWDRVEAWALEAAAELDWDFRWLEDGMSLVGGVEAEWREMRTPPEPAPGRTVNWRRIGGPLSSEVWKDTSVRFYVVPVEDLTVTLVAFESRCACQTNPGGDSRRSDDVENELSMWIPELEAFLASMSFEAP